MAESRRGFLMLGGAALVAGLVDACSGSTPAVTGTGGGQATGGSAPGGAGSGGTSATGGTLGSGGVASGGVVGTGGASASGGRVGTGGAPGTGGVPGTGGTSASGGVSGVGGASTGGGATGTAGAPGRGGATGAGGAPGRGGASGRGGAAGGSGTPGTGGVVTGSGGSGAGGSTGTTPPGTVKWPAEDTSVGVCSVGTVPSVNNAMLPDPLKLFSGKRISTKEEWTCLRAELSAALQLGVYGPKMPKPDSVTATYSGGSITINMTVGTTKGTMTVKVTSGGSASSPKPCVIACGGSSLPLSSYASITMDPNSVASESNLSGLVKTLYGNACAKSGALIGWAWGCSRIIDALELCPDAGIDTKKLMVTGCSRYGKGALAMGAFDERVALTLMQEGGSGGSALWRVSTKEKNAGDNIQECAEITGEAKWQGSDFAGFCGSSGSKIATLPCDQHYAVALCAPRAVLLIENDIDWLGPVPTYGGGVAGRKVFEALGIKDRCGYTCRGNHGHCSFPSNQQADLTAFLNRFIDGKSATTDVMAFQATNTKLGSFKEADWIDWDVPALTGNLPYDPFA